MTLLFHLGAVRWKMLSLIFCATALNYIDRAALGIMQPVLSKSLNWSTMDYANINFWFQAGYAAGYFAQGTFIDRFGVKKVFFLAVLLWSLATGLHGFVTSVSGFIICRLILGFTEAANYPAGVKISRLWFPAKERALATGLFNAGTHIGAMITPILLPILLITWGWQSVFFTLGAVGIVWSMVWLRFYRDPESHPQLSALEKSHIQSDNEPEFEKVPMHRILRMRGTWAFAVAFTLTAPVFWFYLYWLPSFLNQEYALGISVSQIGLPLIIIYLSADLGSIGGGIISSNLIKRGMRPVNARLLTLSCCTVLVTTILLANSPNLWTCVFAIAVGIAAGQAWITNIYNIVMDYTPKHMISTVFGFGGMCAAMGGMLMTQIVGHFLTLTNNNYQALFAAIPGLYVVALAWLFITAPRSIQTPIAGDQ
ncbi:MFS transporter [Pseudomonas sp. A-R-19]|uniref:MFS transporter n=1 Tax=Pseudomonas sp. A-R-19 TaxID=2832403 RepID=UPI001CC00EB5|nr:MFS transporter [Pseudomonas sp. A-R-19]